MASTDTFPLVDRLIDGGLVAYLTTARENGDTYESIARSLASDHDISVTTETVRRWCSRAMAGSPDSTGAVAK